MTTKPLRSTQQWKRFLARSVGRVHDHKRGKLYVVRGKRHHWCGLSKEWWVEPARHVRLTLDGAIQQANNGSCMRDRYTEIYEVDLDARTVKRLWQGKADA